MWVPAHPEAKLASHGAMSMVWTEGLRKARGFWDTPWAEDAKDRAGRQRHRAPGSQACHGNDTNSESKEGSRGWHHGR